MRASRGRARSKLTVSHIVLAVTTAAAMGVVTLGRPAIAEQRDCRRSVTFTLPGITWAEADRLELTNLLELATQGALGSMATTAGEGAPHESAFATIGAGSRTGAPATADPSDPLGTGSAVGERVLALDEMRRLGEEAGYAARPGALGSALGELDSIAVGNADTALDAGSPRTIQRPALLAAMDRRGHVDAGTTGPELLTAHPEAPWGVRTESRAMKAALGEALSSLCGSLIVDQGDLLRADSLARRTGAPLLEARAVAARAADALLGEIVRALDPERDLLLVLSPISPAWEPATHLGVAAMAGPGVSPGTLLRSASTRRAGIVTLPDVAPTILEHFGKPRPSSMTGRPWFSPGDRVELPVHAAVALDRDSVFAYEQQPRAIATWVVLLVAHFILGAYLLLRRTSERPSRALRRSVEWPSLGVLVFPTVTYLVNGLQPSRFGARGFAAVLLMGVALAVAVVCLAMRDTLARLVVASGVTVAVVALDLSSGGALQQNAVFGTLPLVGGRFAGLGNTGFAVFASSALLAGGAMVQRWGTRRALMAAVGLLMLAIVVDGAPSLGSDVGGVLTLVPAAGLSLVLLSGRRVTPTTIALILLTATAFLSLFLALDLSRAPEERTHLGRLVEDVSNEGGRVLTLAIERKLETNLDVFGVSYFTWLVPPLIAASAWLLWRWKALRAGLPAMRAGLLGLLVLAIVGFAVNDSGVVIPALVLPWLAEGTLLALLVLRSGSRA